MNPCSFQRTKTRFDMTARFRLVLGTHNQKKRRELALLLSDMPIDVLTLDDFENALSVPETGMTFRENANLKASVQARHLGEWVLGEDSGLSVDALGGEPGVFSSRYAGKDGDDTANNSKLTESLSSVPREKRGAWYTCHATLADPDGKVRIDVEATCHGRIVLQPRGDFGFGYDPFFEIREYHLTFAELGDAVKSVLSHRARAMRKFLKHFTALHQLAISE